MPVTSTPLGSTAPAAARPAAPGKPRGSLYVLAIVLLGFGVLGWIAGGKYTIEGWIVALNMFARWIGVEQQLSVPRGWWLIAAIVASGVVYSRVELLAWRNTVHRMPSFWIGWILIVLTDVGSTLLGVLNPARDAAPIFHQLAQTAPAAIGWALILTAAPEYLMLSGWRLFRR